MDKDRLLKPFGSISSAEGKLFGLSGEFREICDSGYRCPQCGEVLWRSLFATTSARQRAVLERTWA